MDTWVVSTCLAILNNAAVNICVQVLVQFSWIYTSEWNNWIRWYLHIYDFEDLDNFFPSGFDTSIPIGNTKGSKFSTSSPTRVTISCFHLSCLCGFEGRTCVVWTCISLTTNEGAHLLVGSSVFTHILYRIYFLWRNVHDLRWKQKPGGRLTNGATHAPHRDGTRHGLGQMYLYLQSFGSWLPHQRAEEERRRGRAELTADHGSESSVHRQFSALSLALVSHQNSKAVYFSCFAGIFIVLEEKQVHWDIHWHSRSESVITHQETGIRRKHGVFKILGNPLWENFWEFCII